jgi:hypothetical protein
MEATVTRIEIARHAAADPASVALLLAEPTGLARPADPDSAPDAEVFGELSPVRRTDAGFVAGLEVAGSSGTGHGRVRVIPTADDGCDVRLTLSVMDDALGWQAEGWARTYLDSLVERARLRSSAA